MRGIALVLIASVALAGCWGYSSENNTATGQIKRVHQVSPIFCENHTDVDISLGVMNNGSGSMSTQDVWMTVKEPSLMASLQAAAQRGSIVTVTYDTARAANICCQYMLAR